MLKISVSLITIFLTTLSISAQADTYRSGCLGFARPPEYNFFLIADGPVWLGMEPATCADVDSAADQSTRPGEIWASGSGSMRCFRGLTYLYGNPISNPATAGVRGQATREFFEMLFERCLRRADNQVDPGCTTQGTVSSDPLQCVDPNFTSVPAPAEVTPLAIGGQTLGCKTDADCPSASYCSENSCIPSAPPTAPPPI